MKQFYFDKTDPKTVMNNTSKYWAKDGHTPLVTNQFNNTVSSHLFDKTSARFKESSQLNFGPKHSEMPSVSIYRSTIKD